MAQGDDFQEQVQAMRSVDVNLPVNAALPATPDEIFHVDTQLDPETQKEVVLWEDIQQAFRNAVQVRNKTRVVPFLKGKDLRTLEPRRIAAVPNAVLDVVVDNPVMDNGVTSLQVQQKELQPVPPQNDERTMMVDTASQNTTSTLTATPPPGTNFTFTAPSTTTSAVRRNPAYGLVEMAMENYTHIDRPLEFPSARGPQAVHDEQTYTVKDLPTPIHPNSDNEAQKRGPQSTTTNLSLEMQLARVVISASHGSKDAQVALGDMYRDGMGVAQDYQTAMEWYLKAVKQGDAAGQQRMGGLYDKGFGVPQNYATAMEWYLKAAEQGHAVAQNSIGVLYHFGRGVPRDYRRAMDWYIKAADQGHAASQCNIGENYYFGQGVLRDYTQAMDWYLKAANQGHASAQYNIGFIYDHGQGVPQDYKQALDWYLKAANQGASSAQNNLGVLYQHGRGVPQDYTMAAEWFQKAADQGHAKARHCLEALREQGLIA